MARRRIVRRARAAVADPNKLQKVAAAEMACREIADVVSETDHGGKVLHAHVHPYNHTFTFELADGAWRKLALNQFHAMTWDGRVRASKDGDLLLTFIPEMNSMLVDRQAVRAEVRHTELVTAFGPSFIEAFTEMMGSSPEELLAQALHSIDTQDEKAAEVVANGEEPVVEMDTKSIQDWGAWG